MIKFLACLLFILLVFGSWDLGFTLVSFDPTAISVGARALSMGKACLATTDDADIIFYNPAGLGEIDSFQFTSMSGKVLEDLSYTNLGGIYPLGDKSAVGLGISTAYVQGIALRDTDKTALGTADFRNSVLIVSFGKKMSENYNLGMNLKYFAQDGSENQNGNATAINLDIGLLQKGLGPLSIGLVLKNLISSNQLLYKNGEKEDLPQSLKIGTNTYLLGQKFGAAKLSSMELKLNLDAEINLRDTNSAYTYIGLEASPVQFLFIRAGLDRETETNFTAGVGLKFAGLAFNYAYHPYTASPDNTSHYLSITFDERGWPSEEHPDVFISCKPSASMVK